MILRLASVLLLLSICSFSYSYDRVPYVAGQFYPKSPKELEASVNNCLHSANEPGIKGKPVALVVPHAGYVYSARTAAYAYKLIENTDIDTIILIGNSHRFSLKKASVFKEGSFSTPLGKIEVNSKLAKEILNNTKYAYEDYSAHKEEHSLEVQLPFLQTVLKDFKIVPILLGSSMGMSALNDLSESITKAVKELKMTDRILIIASSDMSHYPTKAQAGIIDGKILKAIESFNTSELIRADNIVMSDNIKNLSCTLCAMESVIVTMKAAKMLGADKAKTLHYSNSADVSFGDPKRVVGYGSLVFYDSINKASLKENRMNDFTISEKSQKRLLEIARETIEGIINNSKAPESEETDPELMIPAAVFVTLTINGNLRGCIGTTSPNFKLYEAVSYFAAAAAFEDHRFSPLSSEELKNTRIEISVLSPMKKAESASEIKENVNGVVVKKGPKSGLFLPQVWEHFSNKDDFLNELCRQKAGLKSDAWKTGEAEIYTFTVFAFEEEQ